MKRLIILTVAAIVCISLFSQEQGTSCGPTNLKLYSDAYRGTGSWERSINGSDWSILATENTDTLDLEITFTSFFRLNIQEGSCQPIYSDIFQITVMDNPTVIFTPVDSVCQNDIPFAITGGSPAGGTYWGEGIEDGIFDPLVAGIGEHILYYGYQDVVSGCGDTVQSMIKVIPTPEVLLNVQDSICVGETAVILTGGFPEGGIFSGPGVTDGKFDPFLAGLGWHQIYYEFEDELSLCSAMAVDTILVLPMTDEAIAGDDMPTLIGDSIQLQANTPTIGIGSWSIVEGSGGSFSNVNDPNAWFIKDSLEMSYTLRWTLESFCGSNSDDVALVFYDVGINPCPGTPIVADADGNTYPTVLIGNQCWMAKNLNVGVFVESTETNRDHSDLRNNGIIEKYGLDNDEANCDLYGGLYDFGEAMGYSDQEGDQGICPEGWHIPTYQEWQTLNSFYKYGDAGEYLKEGGDSGFEGQLAGDRHSRGPFYSFGSSGFFWSSSTNSINGADEGFVRKICACNGLLESQRFNKLTGISVRCIKDSN